MGDEDDAGRVTTGELYRNMGRLSVDIRDLTDRLGQLPDWHDVRRVESGLQQLVVAERLAREAAQGTANLAIKSLEDGRTWTMRWLAGAVGTGVVAIVVSVVTRT